MDFKKFNSKNATVNIRTKAKNSIEFKIENYIKNHENGKVPISKCFNDLFGIRIICSEALSFDEVLKLINSKYDNLKCINSTKNDYKATHIYFKKDNYDSMLIIFSVPSSANNILLLAGISSTLKKYGHLTAGQLVDLTHRANAPWTKTSKSTWPFRSKNKPEVIKEYHKFEMV